LHPCQLAFAAGPAKTFQNPVITGFHPDPSICRLAMIIIWSTARLNFSGCSDFSQP